VSFVLAAAGVAAAVYWYFAVRLPPVSRQPLRIGFEPNPPMQIRTASGFAGLAVETVSQAAKRAGVQLRWVETGTSSDEAFQRGLVDLWPLMADLSDRRKRIHFTRPWLHNTLGLLLRANSTSLDSSFTGPIAVFRIPLNVRLLKEQFPQAQVAKFPEAMDVVKEVCKGRAAAGFLEGRVALNALRDKPSECASVALRVQNLPGLAVQSGVASTFEAAGAADMIRREIGNMYRDGALAAVMVKYSYYGLDDTWASFDLLESAERTRRRAWAISALAIAIALALWLASFLHQRQRAEAMLRKSEERFRATFSQAAVGIANLSIDGKWLLLNDRFCEILGYTQAELSGKTFLDITHPDDREASLTDRRQLLAGEISSRSMEKRYIHKEGGAIVWVRLWISLVRGEDNQPRYFISVVEDITERVQAEQALRESEQRLSLAQSAAHMGVWHLDLATHEITFSADYARLYGLASDRRTLTHQEWLSMIHPDDRGRVQTLIRETLEQSHIWDAEYRVVWPDGTVHWLLAKGTVFLDDSHRPSRSTGVVMDITDRKQAEAVMRRSLDQIAHLNRVAAMGELTGSLAHELNQPLAAILSNAQAASRFLDRESPDLAQVQECLTDIVADDKRAGEVIKRVRALLKKEESGAAQVDLNEVVGDVIRLLQNDAMLRKTSVAFEPAPNLPVVLGDRVQLYQVVLNLMVNGLEASGEQVRGDRWLRVQTTRPPGGAVELMVKDSGTGIAESDLGRVFEPFFTTKREGLGMGLSICRSIVQAHGGRVWAENSAEGGAIFRCVLPAAQQTAAAAQ
jgi:PAS domain S-box-containing protein